MTMRAPTIAWAAALVTLALLVPAESDGVAVSEEKAEEVNLDEWRPQLAKVKKQLELLQLFAGLTRLRKIDIGIPGPLQKVPLEQLGNRAKAAAADEAGASEEKGGLDLAALERRGIEIFVKSVMFDNVDIRHEAEPRIVEDHPAVVSTLDFDKLGIDLDVHTRLGKFPVGCEFRSGSLPFDFDLTREGYAVQVLPENRAADAKLDNVFIDLGGPVANRVLNRFFGKRLAQLVLEYAAGQTLKMDKGSLLGDKAGSSLIPQAGQALKKLLD